MRPHAEPGQGWHVTKFVIQVFNSKKGYLFPNCISRANPEGLLVLCSEAEYLL